MEASAHPAGHAGLGAEDSPGLQRRNHQAALTDLDRLVTWVKANLPPHHQFRVLGFSWQGLILSAAGRNQEALGPTLEALDIAHRLADTTSTFRGEPTHVAAVHRGQAGSDHLLRRLIEQLPGIQLEAARNSLQKALRAYQQTDNRAGDASVLAYLGMTFETSDNYTEASDKFRRSLAIAHHLRNKHLQGIALEGLGISYLQRGDCSTAIPFL